MVKEDKFKDSDFKNSKFKDFKAKDKIVDSLKVPPFHGVGAVGAWCSKYLNYPVSSEQQVYIEEPLCLK